MTVSGISSADSIYTEFLSALGQSNSNGAGAETHISGSQSNSGQNDTLMRSPHLRKYVKRARLSDRSPGLGFPAIPDGEYCIS